MKPDLKGGGSTKPAYSDPEAFKIYEVRMDRFDRLWRARQIGDATYLRSLFIDGMDTADAVSRLNMLKRERT